MPMQLTLTRRHVQRWMTTTVVTLVALCLVSLVLDYGFGLRRQGGFRWLASLDSEQNPQAWYQSVSLFGCAALLALGGLAARRQGERRWRGWFSFAALFTFMSIDEIGAIHERISEPVRRLVDGHGVFFFAWILAWGALLLVVAATHLRWFVALPAATRVRFLVAGTIYVTGAIGFEMLEGRMYSDSADLHRLSYELLTVCEETLEMVGILAFTRALLLHLTDVAGSVELRLASDRSDVRAAGTDGAAVPPAARRAGLTPQLVAADRGVAMRRVAE
jgi:hypothetical protein